MGQGLLFESDDMTQLVLSLFPGIGLLDMAFEQEGFTVVRGPDPLWGGDVRRFHPPAGKFDGVIGGPPCQAFSSLVHLNRKKGIEPSFGNLIPEFVRCVEEAKPAWFLMENVPNAPLPIARPEYGLNTFILHDDLDCGGKTQRKRRISFGSIYSRMLQFDLNLEGRRLRLARLRLLRRN